MITLTWAETLTLWRRRQGLTQRQAAAGFDVSYDKYSAWENGHEEAPTVSLGPVLPHERAWVYRRKTGYTQERVAQEMGVCRFTVRRMEKGDTECTDLLSYWES